MGTPLAVGGGLTGIVGIIIYLLTGVNFGGGGLPGGQQGAQHAPGGDASTKHFTSVILGYTEEVWKQEFNKKENGYGKRYQEPKMVLFSNRVNTGCGQAPSSVGPFYCPADRTLYLDPTFFDELKDKLGGSKAEFSQAYVIAHEVGHHVQNLIGYSQRVDEHRGRRDEKQYSVRLELQADYLAGAWAYHANKLKPGLLEPGDREEALKSARAIGDDRLQKRSQGWASPESYTHGTSAQRIKFFDEGLKTGDVTKRRLDRFFTAEYNPRTGEIQD